MAVAANTRTAATATAAGSLSFNHTVHASSNYIRVHLAYAVFPHNSTTGVTCGGVAMTLVGRASHTGALLFAEVWELVSPGAGSKTIVPTFANAPASINAGAACYSGVDTGSPSGTAQTTSNADGLSASKNVSSAASDMVSDTVCTDFSNLTRTLGGSQTTIFNTKEASNGYAGTASDKAGGATVTMQTDFDSTVAYCHVAANIRASAGAGVSPRAQAHNRRRRMT